MAFHPVEQLDDFLVSPFNPVVFGAVFGHGCNSKESGEERAFDGCIEWIYY